MVVTSCRALIVGSALVLLAGCSTTSSRDTASTTPDDYFVRQLPGLPDSWDPMMSPVDNPILAARRLPNPPLSLVRQALLAQHERWAGTPYRLGGTTRWGIDCSALVQNVFSETFRIDLPRSTWGQVQEGVQVSRYELQPGDLVFFRPPGAYRHVGIYIGDGRFFHASSSRGVMISELDNAYWRRYYWQARRPLEPTTLAQRAVINGEG